MANYTYKFKNGDIVFTGNANSIPACNGGGCVLFLFTTGSTANDAQTRMNATSDSYFCFQITGDTVSDTYQIVVTAATCYICGKAIRPGAEWGTSMTPILLSTSNVPTINIPSVKLVTDNAYITSTNEAATRSSQGSQYDKKQIFDGAAIIGGTGALKPASAMTTYWQIRTGTTINAMSNAALGTRYAALNQMYFTTGTTWQAGNISRYTKVGYDVTFSNGTALQVFMSNDTGNWVTVSFRLYGYLMAEQYWEPFFEAGAMQVGPNAYDTPMGQYHGGTAHVCEGYEILGIVVESYPTGLRYESSLDGNDAATTFQQSISESDMDMGIPTEAWSPLWQDVTISRIYIDFISLY